MVDSPGRITLWGIEVFVATAEEGSISAAARRLGITKSIVSRRLFRLEEAFGIQLLARVPQHSAEMIIDFDEPTIGRNERKAHSSAMVKSRPCRTPPTRMNTGAFAYPNKARTKR